MTQNTETLNKADIFQKFKDDIDFLKDQIEKKESGETLSIDVETYEQILYKGIYGLENNITDVDDKRKFLEIKGILLDKNKTISSEQLKWLGEIFIKLEETDLEKTDLENLKSSIETLRKSKNKLVALKQSVSGKLTPEQEKIKKVKEKVEKYKKKLMDFSTKHPIWTKALILLLPANLVVLFKKKEDPQKDIQHKLGGQILGGALGEIKELFGKIEDFLAQIATLFFSWFAPKEMKELLAHMKADFENIDPNILKKLTGNLSSVTEKVKKFDPEKLGEGKGKLIQFMKSKGAEWFGFTGDKLETYKKVIEQWFKRMKSDDQINDFFTKIADYKDTDFEKLTLEDILSGLGVGLKGTMEFISLLYENKLISVEQIGLKLLKKGGEIVIQTALFFPKMVYFAFGNYKLEDFYDMIKNNQLSEVNKDMFLVMIYRAINTPPFSILQHIAALPGYGISAIANLGENITKGKVFLEALRGNGIDKQLELLSKIEKELTGREGNIYEGIKKSLSYYRKGIVVSYAFGNAHLNGKFDYSKFENEIKNMGLENDSELKALLKDLKNTNTPTTEIQSFVKNMGGKIESITKSPEYASSIGFIENLNKKVGGIFGKTNFFIETTKRLSTSLEKNAKIFEQPGLFKKVEEVFKKFKYAKTASGNVELLDLSHLTKTPKGFEDITKDLKMLAKHSPELLKFAFKNTPVILLGENMIEGIKEGKYSKVLETYMEFIPIVGPIVFACGKYKEGTLSLADLGGTAVWLGFDTYLVIKTKPGSLLKLATMPVVDTAKFFGNTIDIIGRYANGAPKKVGGKEGGIFEKFSKLFNKLFKVKAGRVAVASALLASAYGLYKYFDKNTIKDDNTLTLLKKFSKKDGGSGLVNEEIISSWGTYSDNLKSSLIGAFIGTYMGLDPISFSNYVEDIKKDGNSFTIVFDNKSLESNYIKDKLQEIKPAVSQLQQKLGIEIRISPRKLVS